MPRLVSYVRWTDDDAEVFARALRGHEGALGENEKGKDVVGRHLHRIAKDRSGIPVAAGDAYSAADLIDLIEVLDRLAAEWGPQTDPAWWREQGAPGADDAVAGLALERSQSVMRARDARALAFLALGMVQEPTRLAGEVADALAGGAT